MPIRLPRSTAPEKFVTESCQKVVHNAMQVVGGIGYTNVLPLERIYRDIRLASIWTGTNEVMAMIVAHEWYREHGKHKAAKLARDYALASGAITSGLGYAIWYTVLPMLKSTSAATVQLSVPVIAALGGIVFLGKAVSLRFALASIAVLGGIALVILTAPSRRD